MPLKALIWDVDGTLAETEDEGHRPAFNLAFAEAGLPWHWDSALYAELLAVAGGKERLWAWWRRVDPEGAAASTAPATVQRLHERKTVHYLALLDRGAVALRPGVRQLLSEVYAHGLRQAIATTTTAANVTRLLDVVLGPVGRQIFETIGAGDVVAHKKPAPDIYRWVLERLALPAADCLAIEDSAAGVEAAQRAGVPVLLVRGRWTGNAAASGCVAVLDSLTGAGVASLRRWHARAAA